ncbi:MAG: AMP-binding protein [Gammaproteobacteria bacterium]|nr:AMP-binding protein [Gammaproteobacteria bacterium]
MMKHLPLLGDFSQHQPWVITRDEELDRSGFLSRVHAWAERLPDASCMVLLCESRQHFIIAFSAALIRGQTVLLPTSSSKGAIEDVLESYPESYLLVDSESPSSGQNSIDSRQLPATGKQRVQVPQIPDDHPAVIVFTSGSTGRPQPNIKTWGSLVRGAEQARDRFGFGPDVTVVATVPPQHMYGLETSILVPMITGTRLFGERPFFPADIQQALARFGQGCTLVTTPVHLRACARSDIVWSSPGQIISATAPLDLSLAEAIEACFQAPLKEIFGCTEAGSIASRQRLLDTVWKLYDGFTIQPGLESGGKSGVVDATHLSAPVTLADRVDVIDATHFQLLGRQADMVNVAGKRASLADLNHRLNQIPGVADGVFLPLEEGTDVDRLTAFVVAPGISKKQLLDALAQQIDPVFLPRPLYQVNNLPRNATGKLPRSDLLSMLNRLDEAS